MDPLCNSHIFSCVSIKPYSAAKINACLKMKDIKSNNYKSKLNSNKKSSKMKDTKSMTATELRKFTTDLLRVPQSMEIYTFADHFPLCILAANRAEWYVVNQSSFACDVTSKALWSTAAPSPLLFFSQSNQ